MAILDLQGLALEEGTARRASRRSRRCGRSGISLLLC